MPTLPPSEIRDRAQLLMQLLSPCRLCPHNCGVLRDVGETGDCRTGMGASVAAAAAHFGEEPEISGTAGSGAVFFVGCNLRCLYCQNAQISQDWQQDPASVTSPEALAAHMLALQAQGCHNVNWVSPTHVLPFAVSALALAVQDGLRVPLVYNTNGFEQVETLRLLDGIVDVYLPDLRYSDDDTAAELSGARGYVAAAREAIQEMARQVGKVNRLDSDGTIRRGLVVRLLVLPNDLAGVRESLVFLKDHLGTSVRLALMSQYFPTHRAAENPLLTRRVSRAEYDRVIERAERMGFSNVLVQEPEAESFYRPDFERDGDPFEDAKAFKDRALH